MGMCVLWVLWVWEDTTVFVLVCMCGFGRRLLYSIRLYVCVCSECLCVWVCVSLASQQTVNWSVRYFVSQSDDNMVSGSLLPTSCSLSRSLLARICSQIFFFFKFHTYCINSAHKQTFKIKPTHYGQNILIAGVNRAFDGNSCFCFECVS